MTKSVLVGQRSPAYRILHITDCKQEGIAFVMADVFEIVDRPRVDRTTGVVDHSNSVDQSSPLGNSFPVDHFQNITDC